MSSTTTTEEPKVETTTTVTATDAAEAVPSPPETETEIKAKQEPGTLNPDEEKEKEKEKEKESGNKEAVKHTRRKKVPHSEELPTRHSTRVSKPVERLHSTSLVRPDMSEERKISRIVKMIDLACAIESGENVLPPPVSASSKPAKKTTDDDDVDDDDANDDNDNDNKKSEGETIAAAAATTEPAQKKRKPTLTIEEEEAIFAEGDSDNDDGDDDDDDDDFKAPSKAKSDVKNNKNIDDDDDDNDDDDEKGRKMKRGRKQRKNKKDAPVIGKRIMMNIFEKEFPEYVFSREEVESLTPEQQAYLSCLKVNELKTKLAKNGVSTAGGKRSLVNKVAHCVSVGVPPKCPKCKTGTLRMVGESKFACTGFYKPDDGSEEVKCDFVSDKVDLIPWVAEDGCFL